MFTAQSRTDGISRAAPISMLTSQRREAELTQLRKHISHLLSHFDGHDIALELQRLHNAQPEEHRDGYRMEIAMLSRSYQMGGYDPSF